MQVKNNKLSADLLVEELVFELKNVHSVFEDDIGFLVEGSDLSVNYLGANTSSSPLIKIPLSSMPLLNDYEFSITKDSQLSAKVKQKPINPAAENVMSLMVLLFSQTNKLKSWKQSFVFFVLQDHKSLLQTLLAFRPQGQKINTYWQLLNEGKTEQLLIDSFLGSREFTYKKDALASAGIHTANESEKGLLAVIDFLNHRVGDSGYKINRETGCMEIWGEKENKPGELFVQYGFIDAVQTYLTYGFVDVASPIYFSGRMQFKLKSGLNFVVLGMAGGLQRTIPLAANLQHLNNYLPPGIKRDGGNIVVNELVIPVGEKSSYLSEALSVVLKQCDVDGRYQNKSALKKEVKHIETQLVKLNIQYWQQFLGVVEKAIKADGEFSQKAASDLRTLVDVCIKHCERYAKDRGLKL